MSDRVNSEITEKFAEDNEKCQVKYTFFIFMNAKKKKIPFVRNYQCWKFISATWPTDVEVWQSMFYLQMLCASAQNKLPRRWRGKGHCPAVTFNQTIIPQTEVVKYFGLHFDRRLNWKKPIAKSRKNIDFKNERDQLVDTKKGPSIYRK